MAPSKKDCAFWIGEHTRLACWSLRLATTDLSEFIPPRKSLLRRDAFARTRGRMRSLDLSTRSRRRRGRTSAGAIAGRLRLRLRGYLGRTTINSRSVTLLDNRFGNSVRK